MRFNERFAKAFELLKQDSQDKQAIGEICSSYWTWLAESVGEIIRQNGDTDAFIDENIDLIDYGITSSLVDVAATKAAVVDCDMADCRVQVRTISGWLRELITKAKAGDKVEKLERDLKLEELKHSKIVREIKDIQDERRERVESLYPRPADPAKQLASLESTEEMLLDNIRKKKEISKGVFMSVEAKREYVKQQTELQKRQQFTDSFINSLPDKNAPPEVKRMTKTIEELFVKMVDIESVKKKVAEDLEVVKKKSAELTPSEIENRITEDIEYVRDLLKLSAQRLSLAPFPLIRPEDKLFSMSILKKNLNQIVEFDPRIFKNDRVPLFGRPYVFLVPGTGNAIFDWKNNCILMPTIAPAGNFMGSLATGIIEYRLDVDEDKILITSFNQLPDYKTIRSIIKIKEKLVKEYIIWMTSEYNGYRILSKESLKWFQQEIGPSRNDIFTPLEFQSYTMTSSEFNKLFDETAARIKEAEETGREPDPNDLWACALLEYQQGKPEKALPLFEKYSQARPEDLKGLYNLGFVAMKQMNRTLAREAFSRYGKLDTQSWWSKLVRDHMRNLGPAT